MFAILADGAAWSKWAGPMVVRSWWEREGEPAPGGVGAIRRLGTERLGSAEEIVAYEPPHHLAYTILKGLPVRAYRADVHITADGDGSHIEWSGVFAPKVVGTGPLLRGFLLLTIGGFVKRLARYAERESGGQS